MVGVIGILLAGVTIESHRAHTAAIVHKTEANDQWAFYQAKKIRGHLHEVGVTVLDYAWQRCQPYSTGDRQAQGRKRALCQGRRRDTKGSQATRKRNRAGGKTGIAFRSWRRPVGTGVGVIVFVFPVQAQILSAVWGARGACGNDRRTEWSVAVVVHRLYQSSASSRPSCRRMASSRASSMASMTTSRSGSLSVVTNTPVNGLSGFNSPWENNAHISCA